MAVESLKQMETKLPLEDIAYKANFDVFKGGLSKQEVAKYYDKWAENGEYDTHLNQSHYSGPECCARSLASYFQEEERENARILDVAAGTGRVGAELYNLGFRTMDALDPSSGMLDIAKSLGVYNNFYNDFIGEDHPVPVKNGTYDGLTVSGGFGEGHIPCSALLEMIRVVKSGGVICIAMREEYLDVSEYIGTLLPLMTNLELSGKWKMEAKDNISGFAFGKPGVVFQFRIS